MSETNIMLPSKPKVVKENATFGSYEIDGLYPGYGHTLGNSLRRIVLSSLPGAAVTSVKIAGAAHEFSTLKGVKEDVINIILNIKKLRFELSSDEAQTINLKVKGIKDVTAADIKLPGQVTVANPEAPIASITDKDTELDIEMTIEKGIGYVPKEILQKDRVEIGAIQLDAAFSPILQVNYDVEQMRVGDRTDFNRLRINIMTDGTVTPRHALEKSIEIMITQLKAIIGFQEEVIAHGEHATPHLATEAAEDGEDKEAMEDALKTRIETLDLSQRTINALVNANIRSVGGLIRKKEKDILDIEGLGSKGADEIKKCIQDLGLSFKA